MFSPTLKHPRAPNKPLDQTRIHPSQYDPVYQKPDSDKDIVTIPIKNLVSLAHAGSGDDHDNDEKNQRRRRRKRKRTRKDDGDEDIEEEYEEEYYEDYDDDDEYGDYEDEEGYQDEEEGEKDGEKRKRDKDNHQVISLCSLSFSNSLKYFYSHFYPE